MMDFHALTLLMRLHREDLLREAAGQRLVDEAIEALEPAPEPAARRVPGWWRPIIGYLRLGARLESTRG